METSPETELPENFVFGHGSDQDLSLDLDSFGNTFGELGDLGSSSSGLSKPNISHDDSCLDQPSCFTQIPNISPFNLDHHPGSRHATQNLVNMPPSVVNFQNHQSQMVAMAHNMVQNNESQQGQRSVGRSASFSMVSPQYGGQGLPGILGVAPHPADCCHQTACDQSCPVRKDEQAANALISFASSQQRNVEEDTHACCHFISPESGLFQFPVELPIWNHILSCHGREQPAHCISPCPAESPLVFRKCHIPMQYTESDAQSPADSEQSIPGHGNSICGFKFTAPVDYINHFNMYHRNVLPISHRHHGQDTTSLKQVPSSAAEKSPGDGSTKKPSLFTEETRFMCFWTDIQGHACGENFDDGEKLQVHVQDAHLTVTSKEDNKYRCKWKGCTRTIGFEQRSKLTRHVQTHTGYKAEKCPICGEMLSARQALEQHILTHTGEKPWSCDWPGCGKKFRQQSALTMHMRTHTHEKPLTCEICGRAFSESSNLSKHRKTHSGELPLKCPEIGCARAFRRPDQLRRHMATHKRRSIKQGKRAVVPAGSSESGAKPGASNASQGTYGGVDSSFSSHLSIHDSFLPGSASTSDTETDDGGLITPSEGEACNGDDLCCFDSGCEYP